MAYTILIIVNEPMLTDLLSEHLTHHGYRTHTANNSAQALELLRDQPDLIVLDLALPDGLKLCQQIHSYGAYPLLLLTDHIPQPSQADGFQADKDSYLTKPFRLCPQYRSPAPSTKGSFLRRLSVQSVRPDRVFQRVGTFLLQTGV